MRTGGVDTLVRLIAGHGLPGAVGESPDRPVSPQVWRSLLSAARYQRITGHLVQAIVDGVLPATDEQAEDASSAHFKAMCAVLTLERFLLDVAGELADSGIDIRVLKGSAVAHLDYPDPTLRSFGDIDLLVRSEDFDAAMTKLTEEGHESQFPEPRPGFNRRFGKGNSFAGRTGNEIDLHRTFVMGPFGLTVDLQQLWRTQQWFTVGGRRLPALGAEERFMHACYHAALGDVTPRLVPLRDVAQMVLFGRVDMDRVTELRREWQADAVVARAVRVAWETLQVADVTALSAWARRHRPDAKARQSLAVYTDPAQSYAARCFAAVGAIPRVRDKAFFLRALAFPQPNYVVGRHASFTARLRLGAREIRESRVSP